MNIRQQKLKSSDRARTAAWPSGGAPLRFHRKPNALNRLAIGLACLLAFGAWGSRAAVASTAYGDLNNFDVFNDTGQECHGFEIELDDVRSTDITYTYDWNHYGAPTISEDNSDPAHPKVFVRYAAKYASGAFSAFTAVPATAPSPTDGHMCTDPTVNFGCEHFGVGYYGTPTTVLYHWLIEDAFVPGTLIRGPAVNVATPSWTYYPPAAGQPVAQVQAVILAPPPPPAPQYEFGDATWVKSIVTTSHNNAPMELKDLVSDDPDDPNDKNWTNGEPDEVEVEWHILQTEFNNPDGANNELAGALEELPDGDEVVTRRYEFYKYTGPLDPETNEAQCDNYPQISDPNDSSYKAECDPAVVTVLGDYIGSQMAGFDVEAVLGLIDHVADGDLYLPYTPRTVVVGGNTPYVTSVTSGALPADLTIDSATGVLSGTPSVAGVFSFTITAIDADMVQVSKSYTITVAGADDLCTGVICNALDACHDAGVCDPTTGLCSNPAAPDGSACDDGNACTQADSCSAGVCTGNNPVSCTASDACHVAGVCDPASGACSNPPAPDGSACDDGNACTQTDSCSAGACTGNNPVSCTASDACHVAGVCDPASGACSNPAAPDGSACDDGNACTQTDTCSAGVCTGNNPVSCTASDACHVAGVCDPASGACSNPAAPDGTACSDGEVCTESDTCVAGSCIGGVPNPACASADVALKLRAAPRQLRQQTEIRYSVRVKNFGPAEATAVMIEMICSGVPHRVIEGSTGCVATGGTTTCTLGNMQSNTHAKASIVIAPDGSGVLSCTASVSSATPDPDLINQSMTIATQIR